MSCSTPSATTTHRTGRTETSTSPSTWTTSWTRRSTRGVRTARFSEQTTTACRSCTTDGTLLQLTEVSQRCPLCQVRTATFVAETGHFHPSEPTLTICVSRYLTWSDIDMLNRNYDCPAKYSGSEGTIESHEGYPLIPYNSSYR